ncbi:hypothetical protein J422_04158 [Methanocaldococcus villosus KIN24-T80]|uniref:PGF-pre-PGF domain-containing protein n=1 Tax=Methanocaldococcus villosus KIN24-T80 TaxID=1069083 RepID=N6UUU9_9EURY|nr:PGF-pre-PGF domain-containing protein [Methanocaldococcus villosus]ENN96124.1 hypothetical protein J422_04158 [Methanocaldococcus villosus KIN24-T80]
MIKIKNKTIVSFFITAILASMLVLTQTAAVSVSLVPSTQECDVGDVVNIDATVTILSSKGEWANIKNITLKVEKDGKVDTVPIPLTLEPGKTVLSNKSLSNTNSEVIEVKLLNTTAVYGYGYGYSYVNDSSYGYLNWHYGYGYGYGYSGYGYNVLNSPSNAIIKYNIKWKPNEAGTYKFTLIVSLKSGEMFASSCEVTVKGIEETTTGGGGKRTTTGEETSEERVKSLLESKPEKYIVKEIKVEPGKKVEISIDKEISSLAGLEKLIIELNKEMNLQVIVAIVKSLPSKVTAPPSGTPYSIFEIVFVDKDTGELVEPKGEVEFKVPKSWLKEKGFGKDEVVLERWDDIEDKWEDLPTELVSETGDGYKYKAKLERFCILSVVAKAATTTEKEIKEENKTTTTKEIKEETENKTEIKEENKTTSVEKQPSTEKPAKGANNMLIIAVILAIIILVAAYLIFMKKQ